MSYDPEWVLIEELAKSPRPGYPDRVSINREVVDEWIEKVKDMKISSIICFLSDDQLPFYSGLPSGLIQYYRDAGFDVAHIPEADYKTPPLSEEGVREAVVSFEKLQKPVLVHCSAGLARTGMAIDAILHSDS
jgi:protein-tyrosine phosphatase|tara:strand:- start:807 stop:1205 length:399 start_codon:yes stop_codon:yes gene_type:complete